MTCNSRAERRGRQVANLQRKDVIKQTQIDALTAERDALTARVAELQEKLEDTLRRFEPQSPFTSDNE